MNTLHSLSNLINMLNDGKIDLDVIHDFRDLPVRLYFKNKNGLYLGCNNNMAQSAGIDSWDSVIGQSDFDLSWAKEAPQLQANDQKVIQKKESILFYESAAVSSGFIASGISYKVPLRGNSKRIIGIVGLTIDLDKTKFLKEALINQDSKTKDAPDGFTSSSNTSLQSLSPRQKECLNYLTTGMTIKQIARKLAISPRTVEHHIEATVVKLGCSSRKHLIETLYK